MPRRRVFVESSLVIALALTCSSARALGNTEGEIALTAGWAATTDVLQSNPFGPGLGLRGGVSIHGVYVGAVFVSWFGGTPEFGALQGGLEGGYGFRLLDGLLTLRPKVGAGLLLFDSSSPIVNPQAAADDRGASLGEPAAVYFEPGVALLVRVGTRGFFAGVDANAFVVPGAARHDYPDYGRATPVGVTAHGQLGIRF